MLVLVTVAKFMGRPTVTNVLICSISAGDLLLLLVVVPFRVRIWFVLNLSWVNDRNWLQDCLKNSCDRIYGTRVCYISDDQQNSRCWLVAEQADIIADIVIVGGGFLDTMKHVLKTT